MVLKRSKYGLNTGNSLVGVGTDRAKGIRCRWDGATNGPSARIVKRIVIPTTTANDGSSASSADNEAKLMTMEQKRQLIEQIEQQLTEHVDGGMQATIVTTHNGQQVSVPYRELPLREFLEQTWLPPGGGENQENIDLRDLYQKSKKVPYGTCVTAAMEQPNINRQSSTAHNCDITYSGNKKKRWELMDEVKHALQANNIDLDTFRGRIIAYTSVPTTNTAADNNSKPRVGVSTFSNDDLQRIQRVGKHDVVIATDNKNRKLGTVTSAESTTENVGRKNQSKKSKRQAKQKCSAAVSVSSAAQKTKKNPPSAAPGIQLVYDFIEPLPVNNSFELGKRSYYESKRYGGSGSAGNRLQKSKDAIALHVTDERLALDPTNTVQKSLTTSQTTETGVQEKPVEDAPVVEDNPIWGFISAALKKEARTNQTELNRGGWIVLDIIQQQEELSRNSSTSSNDDDDDDQTGNEEAEYDDFEDDNVSVSTDKSESFEKPNVGVIDADKAAEQVDEEDADGFVLFDVKQLQKPNS